MESKKVKIVERGTLAQGIRWIRINDMEKGKFEAFWPIPHGMTYNSYVIKGSWGFVVIDGSDERHINDYLEALRETLEEEGGGMRDIKHIVVNHLEPDHQATLPELLKRAPEARVVMSKAGPKIAESFYEIPGERVTVVEDGQELDAGGARLRFLFTPWLHWPETMLTYYVEAGVLFTTDAFGSYGAVKGSVFDDEHDFRRYEAEAKRYYVNIISRYNRYVAKALDRISGLRINIIAPSHGIAYRSHIGEILRDYRDWSMPELKGVSIAYASMYGHVPRAVEVIKENLEEQGIRPSVVDVGSTHESYALAELYGSAIIVFAYPTYDASVFMPMEALLYAMGIKEFGKGRRAAIVNTYGWANTVKQADEMVRRAGFELVAPPLAIRPRLGKPEVEGLKGLARRVAEECKRIGC